jgi:ribosomal-protein-alanine N-acetyltransferase
MCQADHARLTINKMQPSDIDSVLWVEESSFRTPWSRKLFEEEFKNPELSHYFVARVDNHVVGYMGFWLIQDEAHITNLAVHPGFRRHHIGEQLLQTVMAYAYQWGARRATLEVRISNEPAKKLYQKYGFANIAIRKSYYNDNKEDALIMWLNDMSYFSADE